MNGLRQRESHCTIVGKQSTETTKAYCDRRKPIKPHRSGLSHARNAAVYVYGSIRERSCIINHQFSIEKS